MYLSSKHIGCVKGYISLSLVGTHYKVPVNYYIKFELQNLLIYVKYTFTSENII